MKHSSLKKQLSAQFYRGNLPAFFLCILTAAASGSLNLILSWIMQQLIDTASGAAEALPLAVLAKLSCGFLLLCAALFLLKAAVQPRFLERAMRQYKDCAFRLLTGKSISAFCAEPSAVYLSALTNDAASIEANYLSKQLSMLTKGVTFFGALVMMLRYSPLMTAIAAAVTALPLAASLLTGGRLESAERRVSDRNQDFTATLGDCLAGFSVVKSFRAEQEIFRLFAESNRALEHEKCTRQRIAALIGMIGAVTGIFAQLGVFLAGAYLAAADRGLTPGTVILFVNLMNFTIEPIAELPGLLAGRRAALQLVEKLADVLEQDSAPCGSAHPKALTQALELRNVSFGYEADRDVLHQISARFEAGKAYAIVGSSGSGKSTLLNLLTAASTGYRGSILLDGAELRDIAPDALYGLLSVIQQNVFVFNATIRDNVTMFHPFPQQALDEAIDRAHLRALLDARGEDALCGENGKELSGGEKQRISIARSLLRHSSVLLADEATAALDAQTAYQVSADLLALHGVTRIVVTHTLEQSLLRQYDGILVLKGGRIVESGSFEELMDQKGYFYALYTVSQ